MPGQRAKLPEIRETKISAEALAALAAIPDTHTGVRRRVFTATEDEIILHGWKTKNQRELCKVLGCAVETARARYKELTDGHA